MAIDKRFAQDVADRVIGELDDGMLTREEILGGLVRTIIILTAGKARLLQEVLDTLEEE